MTQHILLDLDGTLSHPKVGITQSIIYALPQLKEQDAALHLALRQGPLTC